MQNQISTQDTLPIPFEPKRSYKFLLNMDCIDSFLVKSVHLPPLKPDKNGNLVPRDFSFMRIILHSAIAPSTEQKIKTAIKKQTKNGCLNTEIKYLDSIGNIASHLKFKGAKIHEVKSTPLDYQCKNEDSLTEYELLVTFDSMDVLY